MSDLIIVVICLSLNAIFSAYEMAFVTVSKEDVSELESEKKKIGKKVIQFKKRTERTLSVIQIGITMVGAVAAAVGGSGVGERLEPYLNSKYGISLEMAEFISIVVVIVPLTYFSVVFGELIPKTIALRSPKKILILATTPLDMIDRFLSPIVSFLEWSTQFILRRLNLANSKESESLNVEIGHLPRYHRRFVKNLVSLKGIFIEKVFVPKEKAVFFDFKDLKEEIEKKMAESVFSRFPVVDEEVIVGIFHKKEWEKAKKISSEYPWQGILSTAIHINKKERVLDAFLKMQEAKQHLAVVVDEEDLFIGVVSLEDILEEIVGDIRDDIDQNRISRFLGPRKKV